MCLHRLGSRTFYKPPTSYWRPPEAAGGRRRPPEASFFLGTRAGGRREHFYFFAFFCRNNQHILYRLLYRPLLYRLRRRRGEAAGGQLFFLEQPAVHLARWDPMQRGKEADFFPGGQLASWRPAGLPNIKVALNPGVTSMGTHTWFTGVALFSFSSQSLNKKRKVLSVRPPLEI